MTRRAGTRWRRPGVYEYVRHPQYVGFIVIMLGFLMQWPTLLTLLMFPVPVVTYVHLARIEEREGLQEFATSTAPICSGCRHSCPASARAESTREIQSRER